LIPNPAYEPWYDQDQQVVSDLLSSMSEDILRDMVDVKSSKAVWDKLQQQFASTTCARTVQICVELVTTKKRDLSVADYFHKIKGLATDLVVADMALNDEETITYLLAGLGLDYDSFITSMTTKGSLTLDDVYAFLILMVHEPHQLQHQVELQLNTGSSSSVNYAKCGAPPPRGIMEVVGIEVGTALLEVVCRLVPLLITVALLLIPPPPHVRFVAW
jgi:hypothetical protein